MTATRDSNVKNTYSCFRAKCTGGGGLKIYADDFYQLWINGRPSGYGPVKSGPPLLYFDEYTLPEGDCVVAVKVHGRAHAPRLWTSAAGWKCRNYSSLDPNSPDTIGDAGYTEYITLGTPEDQWHLPEFDDRDWAAPFLSEIPATDTLLPRPIPYFTEQKIAPVSVLDTGDGFLADFGRMVYGRPELVCRKCGNGDISVEYIEDLDYGWANAAQHRAMYADRICGAPMTLNWKSFSKRGFRYAAIRGGDLKQPEMCVYENGYPVKTEAGSFRSSDRRLNRLWEISERTLRLCMDDIFNDCPHRDQAQWMDAFVTSKAALSLYGVTDLTRKCILQHAVCSFSDKKFLSPSICGWSFMPDYAMILLAFIRWYYKITLDRDLVASLWGNCVESTRHIMSYRRPDGLLADVPGAYLDNALELCRLGKSAALNAIYVAALENLSELGIIIGKDKEAEDYSR
ncbi:MAG: hypothetical protein PHI35_07810, partial [Victivallaceae bacterium]|nr:hypothetical protein [Victivallaceae bacterium]